MTKEELDFRQAIADITQRFEDWIVGDIITQETETYQEIGERYGLEAGHVSRIAYKRGIQRGQGGGSPAWKLKGRSIK